MIWVGSGRADEQNQLVMDHLVESKTVGSHDNRNIAFELATSFGGKPYAHSLE